MANSKTQIIDLALSQVTENTIIDFDGTTQDASRKGKLFFEPSLKEILRDHPWNFAKARQQLANDAAPAFGWSYAYTLPTQCLRLLTLNGYSTDDNYIQSYYEIEGRQILTDADEAKITYIEYNDDVTRFDPLFTAALVDLLSSKLASIIPGDSDLSERLRLKYDNISLPKAKKVDGNEKNNRHFSTINNSKWLNSRFIQPNTSEY